MVAEYDCPLELKGADSHKVISTLKIQGNALREYLKMFILTVLCMCLCDTIMVPRAVGGQSAYSVICATPIYGTYDPLAVRGRHLGLENNDRGFDVNICENVT